MDLEVWLYKMFYTKKPGFVPVLNKNKITFNQQDTN